VGQKPWGTPSTSPFYSDPALLGRGAAWAPTEAPRINQKLGQFGHGPTLKFRGAGATRWNPWNCGRPIAVRTAARGRTISTRPPFRGTNCMRYFGPECGCRAWEHFQSFVAGHHATPRGTGTSASEKQGAGWLALRAERVVEMQVVAMASRHEWCRLGSRRPAELRWAAERRCRGRRKDGGTSGLQDGGGPAPQ